MFCEKCGTKNDSNSKFCEKCGEKFEVVNVPKKNVDVKEKINSLSTKQKIIGGFGLIVGIILISLYIVGSKLTSMETIGSKAFEQLAKDGKISNKYLAVNLDSKDYFISLEKVMKNSIKEKELEFDYSNYEVKTSQKSIVVKYKDNSEDETYKVKFDVRKKGKSYLFFDKYEITKIIIKNASGDRGTVLYDPSDTIKLTLRAPKGTKIYVEGNELSKQYYKKKKSDKNVDVYVINKIIPRKDYDFTYSFDKLKFKKKIYISKYDNDIDLSNYLSSSYLENEDVKKDLAKDFEKYLNTYYDIVNSDKDIKELDKKYKTNEGIEEIFEKSKENKDNMKDFKIDSVKFYSINFSGNMITVQYNVHYTYTSTTYDIESERNSYVSVKYNLNDIKTPVDLTYMPY